MKKFIKYALFGALSAAIAVGFTGCYGEDIDSLKQDVEQIKDDHGDGTQYALKTVVDNLSTSLTATQGELTAANTKITNLESELATVKATADAARTEAEVAAAIEAESTILKNLISAKADAAMLTSEVSRLEGLITATNTAITNLKNGEIADLRTDVNGILEDYISEGALETTLADYLKTADFDTTLEDSAKLAEILASYPTTTAMNTAIAAAIDKFNTDVILDILADISALESWQSTMNDTTIPGINNSITALQNADTALSDYLFGVGGSATDIKADGKIALLAADIAALQTGKLDKTDATYLNIVTMYNNYAAASFNFATVKANLELLYNDDETGLVQVLQDRFDTFTTTGAAAGSIEEYIAGMVSDIEALADRIGDIEDADFQNQINDIISDLGGLEDTVGDIRTDLTTAEGKIEDIEGRLTGYSYGSETDMDIKDYLDALDADVATLKTDVAALQTAIAGLATQQQVQDMITGINIVAATGFSTDLEFEVVEVIRNAPFGPAGEIEFTLGDILSIDNEGDIKMILKVTPNHADLTAAEFILIDSEGTDYSDIFKITVEAYTGDILTRVAETGLWVIDFAFQDGKKVADLPAEIGGNKPILSFGVINNMMDEATVTVDRIVSTAYDITVGTTDGERKFPYAINFNVDINGGGAEHYSTFKNAADDRWTTEPNPSNPDGTEATDADDRSAEAIKVVTMDETDGVEIVLNYLPVTITTLAGTENVLPYAYYVTMDGTTIDAADITGLDAIKSKDASAQLASTKINIAFNNAYHREQVTFRVWAVNEDGTLVDPDGTAFMIELRSPDQDLTAAEFKIKLDGTYTTASLSSMFTTNIVPFGVSDINFTDAFIASLEASYDAAMELEDPLYVIDNTTPYGAFYHTPDGTYASGSDDFAAGSLAATTGVYFEADVKAMAQGGKYETDILFTETGYSDNITLTLHVTLELDIDVEFKATDMTYKSGMGANNNLIIWPTGAPDATHNLDSSFDYAGTGTNISFAETDATPAFSVLGHTISIVDVVSHLSTPDVDAKYNFVAEMMFGPIWGMTPPNTSPSYGDGLIKATWEGGNNGAFTVELRNRMDWVKAVDANLTESLSTLTTIPATAFTFAPVETTNPSLGGFNLSSAITAGWVLNPTDATYTATASTNVKDSSNPADIDKYFTLSIAADGTLTANKAGGASLNPGETVVLELTITVYDMFNQPHQSVHTLTIQ